MLAPWSVLAPMASQLDSAATSTIPSILQAMPKHGAKLDTGGIA